MSTIAALETEANLAEVTLDYLLDELNPLTDDTTNESQMTRLRDDLEAVNGKFAGTSTKMFALAKDASEMKLYKDAMFPLMRKSAQAMDKANEYLRKLHHTHVPPPVPNPVKLEPIKLPKFAGGYEGWPAFHDLFKSMIYDRTDISGAQKLAYLQLALSGTASSVVASYEHTDANFTEAWTHLVNRYDVKREIIFSHINTYLDFKTPQSNTDSGLLSLVDALSKCIRTLKVHGVPVEHWDCILIALALRKLDTESIQKWTMHFTGDVPTVTEFTAFLETRARSLTSNSLSQSKSNPKSGNSKSSHHVAKKKPDSENKAKSCIKSSDDHHLYQCDDYKKLTQLDKWNFVRQKKLCPNCLRSGHAVDSCSSKISCFKCGDRHHTSLHKDPVSKPVNTAHCTIGRQHEQVVLLGTLLVNVKDSRACVQQCRVFVDNGSESHFITQHCLNRLGLRIQKVNVPLNAIGHEPGPVARAQASFTIESKTESFKLDITALVLNKFAGLIPAAHCQSKWSHFENLALSDPHFHRPHFTDILLGAAKSGHIMLPGMITHPTNPNAPVVLNTRFGWMVNGEAPATRLGLSPRSIHHVTLASDQQNLDDLLTKFWEQEEPEPQPHTQSASDVECEEHFMSTHSLNPDGTYTVQLPFRPDALQLGKSRAAAVRRFIKVEDRLNKQPDIKAEYVKSMREFLSLGYLEPENLINPPRTVYYMPHREVVKESSSTTKVRVVFDASAKTSSGVSLNDTLYTGQKLQVDLFPLLLRFMSYP